MGILESIIQKRKGDVLTAEHIDALIAGYSKGAIPDYQMAAFLMAVCLQGMNSEERAQLTRSMINSGESYSFPAGKPLLDKHSTGGVGDKVSIILAPMLAAAGYRVPMISGRSLGHTGGTLDKLDSIPNYNTNLTKEQFFETIQQCGYAMMGQTKTVVPADKKLYALRDATGTVESIPLICSSILSKKFAEGCEHLVLDVKCGSGAFMKTETEARELAKALLETGRAMGKSIGVLITDMESPLGACIGTFLEIEECVNILDPQRTNNPLSERLIDLTVALCVKAIRLSEPQRSAQCVETQLRASLSDGSAYERFQHNVALQGGDGAGLAALLDEKRAKHKTVIRSLSRGYVSRIDAFVLANVLRYHGAGREKASDIIQNHVGIEMHVGYSTQLGNSDALCSVWTEEELSQSDCAAIQNAFTIVGNTSPQSPLVLGEL